MLGDALLDKEDDDGHIWKIFYCEGCEMYHGLQLNENLTPTFKWNGNNDSPTFSPSILVKNLEGETICHCEIINGMIHYGSESKHMFAGLTIPMSNA